MIVKDEFIAQLERNAANLSELAVTAATFRYLAGQLKKGDPAWWKKTQKAWEKRRFVHWAEASNLFLTCIHFEALSDHEENPLAPFFPSCGGTAEADPSPALTEFLLDAPDRFYGNLSKGQRRYYAERAGALWRVGASAFFQPREMPYYLAEINAGAGLNLLADILRPDKMPFDSELVEARLGFDPAPLFVEDTGQLMWLAAAIYPDQDAAVKSLDRAVEALRASRGRDAAFVQLAQCETALAPKTIAQNVPSDDPEVGLLVYHYMATSRMGDEDYTAFHADMLAMLKLWGDRGLWIEIENVRGEVYSTTLQVRLHRVVNGLLATHEMARVDFAAKKENYDEKGTAKFLAVESPAPKK